MTPIEQLLADLHAAADKGNPVPLPVGSDDVREPHDPEGAEFDRGTDMRGDGDWHYTAEYGAMLTAGGW